MSTLGPHVIVCLAHCVDCSFGQCPGGDHRWADQDDIDHAESIGKPESALGRCGCPCAAEPALEPDEPEVELVSLNAPPCPLCGAEQACGYDAEGRPWIHALAAEQAEQ